MTIDQLKRIEQLLKNAGWSVGDAQERRASKETKGFSTYSETWFHKSLWGNSQINIISSFTKDGRDTHYVNIICFPFPDSGYWFTVRPKIEIVRRVAKTMVMLHRVFAERYAEGKP